MIRKMKKFTLVEVMIVVAVLAVLSVIAIPSFTKNKEIADKKARENYKLMVKTAKERYAMDYGTDGQIDEAKLLKYLPLIKKISDMDVAGQSIEVKGFDEEPVYK
jgi:prepilin-type N-terminal cleavage/methylation domain-containing protein